MFVYVFEGVQNLTNSYHSGGGLVVVAETVEQAVQMAVTEGVSFDDAEIADVIAYQLAAPAEPRVYIFPDAGCC